MHAESHSSFTTMLLADMCHTLSILLCYTFTVGIGTFNAIPSQLGLVPSTRTQPERMEEQEYAVCMKVPSRSSSLQSKNLVSLLSSIPLLFYQHRLMRGQVDLLQVIKTG
jgi:hypothetical protein